MHRAAAPHTDGLTTLNLELGSQACGAVLLAKVAACSQPMDCSEFRTLGRSFRCGLRGLVVRPSISPRRFSVTLGLSGTGAFASTART